VGKTRLALQVAAELLPRFRDGAWLVELAPVVEPDALVEVVARALEVPERQGQPLAASVADFLRAKRVLLLLDNCEHLLDAVADFVSGMVSRSPHVAVLATSREGLGVSGERILVVPSLGVPRDDAFPEAVGDAAAVRLFVERAQEAKAGFSLTEANAAALARLVRRLDGIPLAIELAAARVRSLTPAELAERLDERFRLLAGGRRTAVERHQTLRRAIDWSYELLTEAEQLTLNRAAVFATDFGLHSAEAVIPGEGVDQLDVIDLLGRLVDKSLVLAEDRGETTRYRLLETIRQYAQERLEASGDADVFRRKYAEHYTAFAEAAGAGLKGPDEAAWTERAEAELDHLRAALAWSVAGGQADLALRIVAPLAIQSTRVGYATGSWAAPVAAMPEARGHPLYPQVLGWAAWAQSVAGEGEHATQTARDALDAAASLDVEQRALCRVWAAAGPIAFFSGELDAATGLAERWAAAARTLGDDFELAQALTLAFGPASALGDVAAAMAYSDEAVAVAKRLGNPTAMCLANLVAGMARADADPDLALSFFSRSIEVGEQVGNQLGIGFSLVVLSYFHSQRGEWREATLLAARSIQNLYRAGDQRGFSTQLCAAAMLLEGLGDDETAALLFGTTVVATRHKAGLAASVVAELDSCEDRLRQRLGERFRECVESGTSMDLEALAALVNERLMRAEQELTDGR
jgi:predicted ATPase